MDSDVDRRPAKLVTIFCDGSSLGNGRDATRAAAVALLGFKGLWRAFGTYLGKATNQQAEIAAAALGLEALKVPCRVRLHTDSKYVVETMSGRFRRKTFAGQNQGAGATNHTPLKNRSCGDDRQTRPH